MNVSVIIGTVNRMQRPTDNKQGAVATFQLEDNRVSIQRQLMAETQRSLRLSLFFSLALCSSGAEAGQFQVSGGFGSCGGSESSGSARPILRSEAVSAWVTGVLEQGDKECHQ